MDNRKISICLTTYNRPLSTCLSFMKVLDDERVSEIVIVDDNSSIDNWNELCVKVGLLQSPKIKLFRNESNLGCYKNKREAISKANNENVIIFDSDNELDTSYIDAIYRYGHWGEDVVYAPSFARTNFDYREYKNIPITRMNVHRLIDKPRVDALLNTMNYFVNRDSYLKVWSNADEPYAIDSITQNYDWLVAGNIILVVPGLEYEHKVHDGSLYMQVGNKTHALHKKIKQNFKNLR